MTDLAERPTPTARPELTPEQSRVFLWFSLQCALLLPIATDWSTSAGGQDHPRWMVLVGSMISVAAAYVVARTTWRLARLPRPVSVAGYALVGSLMLVVSSGPLVEGSRWDDRLQGVVVLALGLLLWTLVARDRLARRRTPAP